MSLRRCNPLLVAEAMTVHRLSTSNLAERGGLPSSEANMNGGTSPDAEAVAKLQAENAALVEKVKGVDKRIAGAAAVQVPYFRVPNVVIMVGSED